MKNFYLSYLMGGKGISDEEIQSLEISIEERNNDGDRSLKIPKEKLSQYIELIKPKLSKGFWNEIIGENEIIFIFKFEDGLIKNYILSQENEQEIAQLCERINNEPADKTANVYKYLSGNKFYHDFMVEHYAELINRRKI